MSNAIHRAIATLQSQLKHHQDSAARLVSAIAQLQTLTGSEAAAASPKNKPKKGKPGRKAKAAAPKRTAAKVARTQRRGKPTLASALHAALTAQKGKGMSANALYTAVQKAGFKFGGRKQENNMNYLYKTLRRNNAFKRAGDGLYAVA